MFNPLIDNKRLKKYQVKRNHGIEKDEQRRNTLLGLKAEEKEKLLKEERRRTLEVSQQEIVHLNRIVTLDNPTSRMEAELDRDFILSTIAIFRMVCLESNRHMSAQP